LRYSCALAPQESKIGDNEMDESKRERMAKLTPTPAAHLIVLTIFLPAAAGLWSYVF
jgi:hypothetical protein